MDEIVLASLDASTYKTPPLDHEGQFGACDPIRHRPRILSHDNHAAAIGE